MAIDELAMTKLRKERTDTIRHFAQAESVFITAWVNGVRRIGEEWFTYNPSFCKPATSLDEVNNKWQVIPDFKQINKSIGVLSSGEAVLLAAMCSFYNADMGGKLLNYLGIYGLADISAKLDLNGRRIIADLILNYTGW